MVDKLGTGSRMTYGNRPRGRPRTIPRETKQEPTSPRGLAWFKETVCNDCNRKNRHSTDCVDKYLCIQAELLRRQIEKEEGEQDVENTADTE